MTSKPKTTDKTAAKPAADTGAAGQQSADTAGASQGATNNEPPAPRQDEGAAQSGAAPNNPPRAEAEPRPEPRFITLGWPLPKDFPERALENAVLVVKSKSKNGRWRAARKFSREETAIPLAELKGEEIAAIAADPQLIVSVKVPEPS